MTLTIASQRKTYPDTYRKNLQDGCPCVWCGNPIENLDRDTYKKNRGTHKLCFIDLVEHRRHRRESRKWYPRAVALAKYRSKKKGYRDFVLKPDHYIYMPTHCPVFGTKLRYIRNGKVTDNSASLDQIIPGMGYNYRNAVVVSWRANKLKADASSAELRKVVWWMIEQGA